MSRAPVFSLAVRSILNRRATALLTMLTVAISVALFTSVDNLRTSARESFENTLYGVDLIVGARSSPIGLLLYSVFHMGDATNNVSWESYQAVAGAPGVEWTAPISLGDSHRGFRVVGTTQAFFEHYQYAGGRSLSFVQGSGFDGVEQAVIGAAVARELGYETGAEIIAAHGMGEVSFVEHDDNPFTVVGVLAPTGTPTDRSVLVSLESIELIHGAPPDALEPTQITAFLVGMREPAAALRLLRQVNTYPEEPLLAIIPGPTLAQLWTLVGTVERTLAAVAGLVVLTGLISILAAILTSLNERRREMAILRALGARPGHIVALLVSEAAFTAFAGAVVGVGLSYAAMTAAAPIVESRFGLILTGLAPGLGDLAIIAAVTAAAALLGLIPAWRAFRNSLADGMTIRV